MKISNRRIVMVRMELEGEFLFTNLEKAIEYLTDNHRVVFTDSYRVITDIIKYKPYKFKHYLNRLWGEITITIERKKVI